MCTSCCWLIVKAAVFCGGRRIQLAPLKQKRSATQREEGGRSRWQRGAVSVAAKTNLAAVPNCYPSPQTQLPVSHILSANSCSLSGLLLSNSLFPIHASSVLPHVLVYCYNWEWAKRLPSVTDSPGYYCTCSFRLGIGGDPPPSLTQLPIPLTWELKSKFLPHYTEHQCFLWPCSLPVVNVDAFHPHNWRDPLIMTHFYNCLIFKFSCISPYVPLNSMYALQ